MARVVCLTHSELDHRKSGVRFEPTKVRNARGALVWLGVAEVSDAVAREYFLTNTDHFRVDGLTSEPLAPPSGARSDTTAPDTPPLTPGTSASDGAPEVTGAEPPVAEPVKGLDTLEAEDYTTLKCLVGVKGNIPKAQLVATLREKYPNGVPTRLYPAPE